MDFAWDSDLQAFRDEVREFIRRHWSPELYREVIEVDSTSDAAETATFPRLKQMRSEMLDRGWLTISVPMEYGGGGKSPWYQYILVEEMSYAGLRRSSLSVDAIAPAILRFGTEIQKGRYLSGIYNGDITFALGYSEPNAGSDLAAVETSAARDGDDYVINGQKIWTTAAHSASHVWLLARTDPSMPKHRGLSVFILPLRSPGITVRPLPIMSGGRTNETFYDNVRVSADALIGTANSGWYYAMEALNNERISVARLGAIVKDFDGLIAYLKDKRPDLLQDSNVRLRLAEAKLHCHVQRALKKHSIAILASGATPVAEASMTKIWSTDLQHRMSNQFMDLLGRYGGLSEGSGELAPMSGVFDLLYREASQRRFGGGTNDIQRDIIARHGLGMPQ